MSTRSFFDEMARSYDADVVAIGWDPIALLRSWPFHASPGARVLDAGCGTGAVLETFAGADRELAGLDLSERMLREARKRGALRGADLRLGSAAEPWPFEDATFDVVLCLAMLEFVPALDEALDELARVIAPGGRALFSVEDVFDTQGVRRPEHERRYGVLDLWRRPRDTVELSVPPALRIERMETRPGYLVDDAGFVCAYHVVEVVRPHA